MKLRDRWHLFWMGFHQVLLESCIDKKERSTIRKKIMYHQERVNTNVLD